MKISRSGKASIFKSEDIKKIRKSFDIPHHRAIFEIALFTGERMGAIVQLKVSDVYDRNGDILECINFSARTRKKGAGKQATTRQVVIHPDLKAFLQHYLYNRDSCYLFPSTKKKQDLDKHITYRAIEKYWKEKFKELGIDNRGYSTHSARRTFITKLARNGIDIRTIQAITGHKNIEVLLEYVEVNLNLIKNAIASVTV